MRSIDADLMVHKAQMISRETIGQLTTRPNDEDLMAIYRVLAVFPGFA
jgi:hypothetical protein